MAVHGAGATGVPSSPYGPRRRIGSATAAALRGRPVQPYASSVPVYDKLSTGIRQAQYRTSHSTIRYASTVSPVADDDPCRQPPRRYRLRPSRYTHILGQQRYRLRPSRDTHILGQPRTSHSTIRDASTAHFIAPYAMPVPDNAYCRHHHTLYTALRVRCISTGHCTARVGR
eukprot:2006830-Rhodomonas_salina.5